MRKFMADGQRATPMTPCDTMEPDGARSSFVTCFLRRLTGSIADHSFAVEAVRLLTSSYHNSVPVCTTEQGQQASFFSRFLYRMRPRSHVRDDARSACFETREKSRNPRPFFESFAVYVFGMLAVLC
jgi:hypothetical protein